MRARSCEDTVWRIAVKEPAYYYRSVRDKTMILGVHGDYGCDALSWRLRLKINDGAGASYQKAPSVQVDDIHASDSTPNRREAAISSAVCATLGYPALRSI
jgi:hypothetical protein